MTKKELLDLLDSYPDTAIIRGYYLGAELVIEDIFIVFQDTSSEVDVVEVVLEMQGVYI